MLKTLDGPLVETARSSLWHAILEYESHVSELRSLLGDGSSPPIDALLLEEGLPSTALSMPFHELRQKAVILFKCADRDPQMTDTLPTRTAAEKHAEDVALVHFGVEVRHLPLAKQLQGSAKFVPTSSWALARDELKFSRCFDRVAEMRQSKTWSFTEKSATPKFPTPASTVWERLLEEMWFMARDFEQEQLWKRRMAKSIAEDVSRSRTFKLGKNNSYFLHSSRTVYTEVVEGQVGVYAPGSGLVLKPSFRPLPGRAVISSPPPLEANPAAYPTLKESFAQTCKMHIEWSSIEDSLLVLLVRTMPCNALLAITSILNYSLHNNRSVRSTIDVLSRAEMLPDLDPHLHHRCKKHLDRTNLMNSSLTKLIVPKPSIVTKKLNLTAHPSHEAAARKANQNISKFFTPQELAMRRIQRTRIISDSSGNIINSSTALSSSSGSRPMPPGSPNQRQVTAAAYQAAIAAAAVRQQAPVLATPANGMQPTQARLPTNAQLPVRSGMPVSSNAIAQQQRQALLHRSHQIGNYIAIMQSRPANSPLLRPPPQQFAMPPPSTTTTAAAAGHSPPSTAMPTPASLSPGKAPFYNQRKSSAK